MSDEVEKRDPTLLLEDAVSSIDMDAMGLVHNMVDATLELLHEIISLR